MMGVGTRQFRPGPEWLSPLDLSNLRTEDQGLRMHVAALAILDAERLLDSAEKLRLRDIRADVELERGRAAGFARSHTIAIRPRPPPFRTGDPHVRHCVARQRPLRPGDEAALLALCSELNEPATPRSRPL